MKYRLLNYIVCPKCKGNLKIVAENIIRINYSSVPDFERCKVCNFTEKYNCKECITHEVKEGNLICPRNKQFPITNFTPRMLENKTIYATKQHFEIQWEHWGHEERIFGKTEQDMLKWCLVHVAPSGMEASFFHDKLILDAGCGHGKFSTAFARLGNEVIGMDITGQVEKNYINNLHKIPLLHFIQGDVLAPPFEANLFDYIISIGVMHHTGNTRLAFHKLAQLVNKKNGILGLWIYPIRPKLFEVTTKFLRFFTTRIPKKALYALCFIPVPLLHIIKAYSKTSLSNSSWRQCAQVVFDFFGPKYQTHHTEEEIRKWFAEEDILKVDFFRDDPISAAGMK